MMVVNLISLTNCQYSAYSLFENKWTSPPSVRCNRQNIPFAIFNTARFRIGDFSVKVIRSFRTLSQWTCRGDAA